MSFGPVNREDLESVHIGERIVECPFIPSVGDRVEFLNDRLTEKGPSSGSVISVDRDSHTIIIRHSDHPGETFSWSEVRVRYFSIAHDGCPLWAVA
jgi:hypothetical protein